MTEDGYLELRYWTAPMPSSKGGRVRVQAGDKCVAPGKFKPKKRQVLTEADHTGISMECVTWSDRSYGVREIVQQYGSKMPVIIRVTEGYHHGQSHIEFSQGQVIQLHSFGDQDRMRVRTSKGRDLSIPLDCPIHVRVLDGQQNDVLPFEVAARKFSLPLRLSVLSADENAHSTLLYIIGQEITVLEGHEDIYLRANIIHDGWIDQSHIVIVPSFLDIQMVVALDMQGATAEEWHDYYNMFARSVRHLNFKKVGGYAGIIFDDGLMSTSIDDIHLAVSSSTRTGGMVYENIPAPPRTTPAAQEPALIRDPVYENLSEKKFQDRKLPPKQSEIPPRLLPRGKTPSPKTNRQPYENVQMQMMQTIPGPKGDWRPERPAADGESGDELDVTEMFDRVLEVAEEEEKKRTASQKALASDNSRKGGSVSDLINQINITNNSKNLPQRRNPPGKMSDRNMNAPRAVVQPTFQGSNQVVVSLGAGDIHNNNNKSASYVKGGHSNFQSIEDVPTNLDSLTVEDVSQCLRLLNMENHISTFRAHQVDGSLLSNIQEQTLKRDFGMTDFNASKLMRFIRGWRPKLS